MNRVQIQTGARLHFGLLCTGAGQPGQFAGIGLMTNAPGWTIDVCPAHGANDHISLPDPNTPEAAEIAQRVQTALAAFDQVHPMPRPRMTFRVIQSPPLHCGFGAGTQLGLAVVSAAHLLQFRNRISAWEAARRCGRAGRSAIGTAGFETGGFLIDAGDPPAMPWAGRVRQLMVPDDWRFVIVRQLGIAGTSGAEEKRVFARDLRMSPDEFRAVRNLVNDRIIPALRDGQFAEFAESLAEYGRRVGTFFSAEQGGCYSDPRILPLAELLDRHGCPAPVQSSWGPTVCIPAASPKHAQQVVTGIDVLTRGDNWQVEVVEPLNRGATLRTDAPEPALQRSFG